MSPFCVFSGFDSAWGQRNKGALCHLGLRADGDLEFVAAPDTCTWSDATEWARTATWENHVVAIDQSLVQAGRFYFECFPHPALLGLFDLDALLEYKVRHRDRSAWERLLALLRSLEHGGPRLSGIGAYAQPGLPQTRDNENKLDSVVAAYVAAYRWHHGTRRSVSLGSLSDGYIVTPVSERTRAAFDRVFAPSERNERGRATCARPT